MKKNKTIIEKKTKPSVRYPLFKISRNADGRFFWIIAKSCVEALSKASLIWKRKKLDTPKTVSIEQHGSVDYIPALKRPHWES